MDRRFRVGILGATGTVGQRFIQLLEDHPQFEVTALAASDRSQGKTYTEACAWRLPGEMPERARAFEGGFIVTNPNCSTIMLAMALAPLHARFGVEAVVATTMQALSGAGYPGVASLDIADNVLPFIESEEEKMEAETLKILGRMKGGLVEGASMRVSAQ